MDRDKHDRTEEIPRIANVYKSKNEAVSEKWSIKDGRQQSNESATIATKTELCDAAARRQHHSPDKFEPIRDCFETWNGFLREAYIPGESITVDEQLVTFRGKCSFRQYIASKPGRYGINIWAICDKITSYAWKMKVYTGNKLVKEVKSIKGKSCA